MAAHQRIFFRQAFPCRLDGLLIMSLCFQETSHSLITLITAGRLIVLPFLQILPGIFSITLLLIHCRDIVIDVSPQNAIGQVDIIHAPENTGIGAVTLIHVCIS